MKINKIVFVLILIGISVVCFIAGWRAKNVQIDYNYGWQIDSLKQMEYLRRNAQLPYFGKRKEDVLKMLSPLEEDACVAFTLFDNGNLSRKYSPWGYSSYVNRVKNTKDTLFLTLCYWKIPYNERPDLYIVFEKKDTNWIVTSCTQYNSDIVQID